MFGISSASDVVKLPFQLLGGVSAGTWHAIKNRGVGTWAAPPKSSVLLNSSGVFANKHVGEGMKEVLGSGILDDFRGILGKDGITKFWSTLTRNTDAAAKLSKAALGLRGIGLLVAGGFLAGVGVYLGAKLFKESWHKVSKINQGYHDDVVDNVWIHGAQALTGLAMAVGGMMAFIPGPTMAIGAGLAISGFVGALGLHALRYVLGGNHVLKFHESLPWPFDRLVAKFKNEDASYYR